MSTRSVISFYDKDEQKTSNHVYKHHDGYPSGVWEALEAARPFAWDWPRYEAMEFAAAFVRGNKEGGGSIYFSQGPNAHWDLAYSYCVSPGPVELMVACYAHKWHTIKDVARAVKIHKPLFAGTLTEFGKWALKED